MLVFCVEYIFSIPLSFDILLIALLSLHFYIFLNIIFPSYICTSPLSFFYNFLNFGNSPTSGGHSGLWASFILRNSNFPPYILTLSHPSRCFLFLFTRSISAVYVFKPDITMCINVYLCSHS